VLLGGVARVPTIDEHTPNAGVVMFDDTDGVRRRIDFLDAPLGLDADDVRATAVQLELGQEEQHVLVWLMHPERCMESRICNVQILGIDDDHAMAQLRASIEIAREWSRLLLGDESVLERDRVRAVLRINERIFRKCVGDLHFRAVYEQRGIDPFDAVIAEHDRLPAQFRERRYPQMLERVNERRRSA
jgi:hypothetical protein